MATETVHMKGSGMRCSFCTMSIEQARKRYPGCSSTRFMASSWSRPTWPRAAGRSLLRGLALIRRCHYEYRNDR